VDVKPSKIVPTWHNERFGVDGIQKILDMVYESKVLLNDSALFRSWVELPFIPDCSVPKAEPCCKSCSERNCNYVL
jgi:hypothetical protein